MLSFSTAAFLNLSGAFQAFTESTFHGAQHLPLVWWLVSMGCSTLSKIDFFSPNQVIIAAVVVDLAAVVADVVAFGVDRVVAVVVDGVAVASLPVVSLAGSFCLG